MKRTIVILAVAAASVVAFAQPPPNPAPAPSPAPVAAVTPPSAPMVKKETAQIPASGISTPLTNLTKPIVRPKFETLEGMSSRPWAQIVGFHPGDSAFPPPERHESSMYLFWVGRDPH
jgi:hypothetical protein